jgi:hypothetical protein
MTVKDDLDRHIESWVAEGPHRLPDAAVHRIVGRLDERDTPARIWLSTRDNMYRYVAAVSTTAAVALVAIIGFGLVGGGRPLGPGGAPASMASDVPVTPGPTVAPSASPGPTTTPASSSRSELPQGRFDFVEFRDGMSMTVRIPASGWHFREQRSLFSKGDESATVPEAWFMMQSNPPGTAFYVPADPCRVDTTKPQSPATTVDDLVADLAAQDPGGVSQPVDVSIGGYTGKSITLHVPDDTDVEEGEEGFFVRYGYAQSPVWHYDHGLARSTSSRS